MGDVDERPGPPEGESAEPTVWSNALLVVRRCPLTIAVIVAMLVIGLASGALWKGVHEGGLLDTVGYGPPALGDGRLPPFLYGSFFAVEPFMYLTIIAVVGVFAGMLEWRAGWWKTGAVLFGTQIGATIITAALLLALRGHGYEWVDGVAYKLDVGFSAGAFGCGLAMTAFLTPRWRLRVRVALLTYLVLFLLFIGLIWDVEHLIAALLGLAVGPLVAGRKMEPLRKPATTKRQNRVILAYVVMVAGVIQLLGLVAAGERGVLDVRPVGEEDAGSAFAVVVISVILLVLADGIRRGRRVAWVALLVVLVAGIATVLLDSLEASDVLALVVDGGVLIYAIAAHASFRAAPEPRTLRRSVIIVLGVLLGLLIYSYAGFRALASSFTPEPDLGMSARELASRLVLSSTNQFRPTTTLAEWFVGSIGLLWVLAIVGIFVVLVRSSKATRFPADREAAIALLRQYGGGNTSWMTTWEGNTYWATDDGDAYVAYRLIGSVCLVLGDPIGSDDGCRRAINDFRRFCFRRGWLPCWYGVGGRFLAEYHEQGWQTVQVGEDTVVDLPDLAFKGKSWQDVRTALNKAEREGLRLESTTLAGAPHAIADQLQRISDDWAGDKSLPEMGFTLGTLKEAEDPEVRMTIAIDEAGSIHGMTSWLPVYRDGAVVGWTVDVMRRRFDGFRSVMEFLIGSSAILFKDEGYAFLSLSAAPLARTETDPDPVAGDGTDGDTETLQKVLDMLADKMEPYYGFKSLLAFKKKFKPHFDPVYLVYPDAVALASIGQAISKAYVPDLGPRSVVQLLKSRS